MKFLLVILFLSLTACQTMSTLLRAVGEGASARNNTTVTCESTTYGNQTQTRCDR